MKKIDDNVRDLVVKELNVGNLTYKQITKKHNISMATVYRIKKQIKDGVVKKEKSSKVKENKTTVIKTKSKREQIKVGLIADRHKMPVNDYIFNNEVYDMFNYTFIDSTVSEFILNKIGISVDSETNEHIADKDLVVYITGLTSATASVIKMCSIYKVNLTLMHYNIQTGSYERQVIFKDFGKSALEVLFPFVNGNIILEDCTFEEFNKLDSFYLIKQIIKSQDDNIKDVSVEIYKDLGNVWKRYAGILKEVSNCSSLISLFIEEGCIRKGANVYQKSNTIIRSYNYESKYPAYSVDKC